MKASLNDRQSTKRSSPLGVVYDGDGNRVSETAGGVTTAYLVDTLNPTGYSQVLDELVSGSVTKTYTYGLQRISENQLSGSTWTPTFYGYDGHGNVRFLASAAGTVSNTYQYDAFGMPVASTGTTANTYLYSGERFDSNLNLYHLRARYYNQGTGRFETMDPGQQHESCCQGGKSCCGSCGSQAEDIFHPGALHKYVYAQDDPVNRIDPTGRQAILEYEANVSITRGERVAVGKLAYQVCIKECENGCDTVIVENPGLDVQFLILCYLACEPACRSIYPA